MRVLTALRRVLTATSGPTRRCSCGEWVNPADTAGDWKRHINCK
jgi:hypothetical protein